MKFAKALKYQRTEYGKQIRKEYESGQIKERRCNMREYTVRNDEITNTLTTVLKDNYIIISNHIIRIGGYKLLIKNDDKQNDKTNTNKEEQQGYRIRKLTPLECWRLMAFEDKDFYNAKKEGISNTQLYKQAGNSIVVDVLYYIYRNLYEAMPYLFNDLKVSSFFSGIGAFEKGLDKLYEDINNNKI